MRMPFLEARTSLDHLAAHKGGGQLTMGGQIRRGRETRKALAVNPSPGLRESGPEEPDGPRASDCEGKMIPEDLPKRETQNRLEHSSVYIRRQQCLDVCNKYIINLDNLDWQIRRKKKGA